MFVIILCVSVLFCFFRDFSATEHLNVIHGKNYYYFHILLTILVHF